jgi:hypothetical protein
MTDEFESMIAELDGVPPRQRDQKLTAMLNEGGMKAAVARLYLQRQRNPAHGESPGDKMVQAPQKK